MPSPNSSLFQSSHLKHIPFIVWSVLIGTLIVRVSYYMAWPFLVVTLYRDYGASATEVGSMLAMSALVGVLAGFYTGHWSDIIGRQRIIVTGCLVSSLAYFGLSESEQLLHFYLLIVACGLMRPMIEEPSKALISDRIDAPLPRELAMNLRYFAINVGGAVGPLLGVTLAVSHPEALFQITSVTYLSYALALLIAFRYSGYQPSHRLAVHPGLFAVLQTAKRDGRFMKLLLANLLMMFVYAHYSSTLPQVIARSASTDKEMIIAGMVLINTLTVIIFQFPLLKWLQRYSLTLRAKLGVFLMGLSQLVFAASSIDTVYIWFGGCFLLSLGEVIAFPTINVQIDRLAPEHLRGAYFGLASLHTLGFVFAPLVGGLILDVTDAMWLFSLCMMLCLITLFVYSHYEKHLPNESMCASSQ
ncbi:MDR family MFS transporter [Vibrio coralliilyticus]|uniref:MDR family MFS transporter n=1 Tax=Vibrio coralliilyticus TaxID=190893 RepID=UPI000BAAF9F7|nr:MFS transporter [Vibrio coralliilyticus]NOI30471.1 MFS transporter [Vibrio coralliilyticus]NOI50059.1 MFS transporter [Vibrio coralliilyticus]NOI58976.1 MFS transporter [Vibrio coralliilyticus]PAT66749.1 MFS transporter [Vibrio coralliilyticus]